MKNKENQAKEIFDIACTGSCIAVDKKTNKVVSCSGFHCDDCLFDLDNCRDKVKEWCESEETKITIPEDTPVDARILVSHDGENWFRRHFAKFDENFVAAWCDGKTSWSVKSGTSRWEYAKLAED